MGISNQKEEHTRPTTTSLIRFAHRAPATSASYEEQEHTCLTTAWESFRMFAEPDSADLYSEIELVEYDYSADTERLIARLALWF